MTTRAMTSRPAARRGTATRRQPAPWSSGIRWTWSGSLLGLAVLGIGFLIAQRGQLSVFERDLFRLVNDLPAIVFPLVWVVMQLGNVVAVPVLAGAAALARPRSAWRATCWCPACSPTSPPTSSRASSAASGRPGSVDANLRDGNVSGIGFISGHAAVAAALATAAAPYLSRRGRRAAWALAWAVALARVYVGAHLPLDVVGGVAVGWAIGSLVH